jgi:hypothetical protein
MPERVLGELDAAVRLGAFARNPAHDWSADCCRSRFSGISLGSVFVSGR